MRVLLGLLHTALSATALRVAVLSNHDPLAWTNQSCSADGPAAAAQCNLRVYSAAAYAAAYANATVLVLPEAYALQGSLNDGDTLETWLRDAEHPLPCDDADAQKAPIQVSLSCLAREAGVVLIANVFVSMYARSHVLFEAMRAGSVQAAPTHRHRARQADTLS